MKSEAEKRQKRPTAFSKKLLIQESALIWLLTLSFIGLAFLCVLKGYTGTLPWLSVTLTGAWGAYGVTQAIYYYNSKAENTSGGITYETAMSAVKSKEGQTI
jgi:hypothetical protein